MKSALIFLCLLTLGSIGISQTLPSGFAITDVSAGAGWSQPVGAAFTRDGLRLFVWEKDGRVFVCTRNGTNYVKQGTPVLNISDEVGGWRDFGLLGFALDPNFESNGYIYLLYVVDRHHLMTGGLASNGYNPATNQYFNATIGRVTRYTTTMSGGNLVAIPSSRRILLGESRSTGIPILHESHGVGGLAFAADGTLLVSGGDGASYVIEDAGSVSHTYFNQALIDGIIRPQENVGAFRSQMLNSHNGKLLRINPENGDGISSNPFFDASAPRSAKSRVWALGLRNPFRIFVKPGTGSTNPSTGDIGEVFIGDVGWGTWEEQNVAKTPGANFGWPLYEGHTVHTGYMALNTQNGDEPNTFGSCGGRSNFRFKDLLRQDNAAKDKSVYNPCNSSQLIGTSIRYLHARPSIDWRHGQDIARVGKFNAAGTATNPTIGTPESEVIGAPFQGNCSAGGIWYTGAGNSFPAQYKNTFIAADYGGNWLRRLSMDFTDVITRVDNFGTGMGAVVSLTENPLDGSIVLVNVSASTVRKITFGGNIPPIAVINASANFSPATSMSVSFDGTASYDQNGSIASYSWNFGDPGSPGNTSTSPTPTRVFTTTTGPRQFIVTLTVTDNGGATGSSQYIVSVNNTPPNVTITSPVKNSKYKIGPDTTYMRQAVVTDNEHSASQLTYEWQTTLVHNNHLHPEAIDNNVQSGTLISRIGCNGDNYSWLVKLRVTDAAGLSAVDSSLIFPDCAGSLPLFLHKFSVTKNGNENLLKWTTEQESDLDYFELERSNDGVSWYAAGRIQPANSGGTHQYSYPDNPGTGGQVYYRLKIVELNQSVKYSLILRIDGAPLQETFTIVPNPVSKDFSVIYPSTEDGMVTILIRDVSGRLVHRLNEGVSRGSNVIYIQSLLNMKPGVYFITINQKGEIRQGKLIKAR